MTLSKQEVAHIAHLARLELSPEDLEIYREQLSGILEHVAKLQSLDTGKIEPLASIIIDRSRLREDAPGESLSEADLLRNAPHADADQFRVPPVLDQDG